MSSYGPALIMLLLYVGTPLLLLLLARRFRPISNSAPADWLPVDAPRPSRTSAWTELGVLAFLGAAIIVLVGTDHGRGGLWFDYARRSDWLASYAAWTTALVVAAYAAALVLAWRRRGLLALFAITATACVFGYLTMGSGAVTRRLHQAMQPPNQAEPIDPRMTLDVGGSDVVGADLYVNNVYLGKTPVTMTTSEFLAKVPVWEPSRQELAWNIPTGKYARPFGPPETARTYNEMHLAIDWQDADFLARTGIVLKKAIADELRARRNRPGDGDEAAATTAGRLGGTRSYYVQVKHHGEFGWAAGDAPSTRIGNEFHYALQFRFPTREQKLEALLDAARLADYQADEAWFDAMDDFGNDGWNAVAAAAEHEPGMQQLFDACARRMYGIRAPRESEPLARFKQICDEADRSGFYSTAGLTGRAVALLAPQISTPELIALAAPVIRDVRGFGRLDVSPAWRMYFYVFDADVSLRREYSPDWRQGFRFRNGEEGSTHQFPAGGHGFQTNEHMKPSYLAIAHAVWAANRRDDSGALAAEPTALESAIGDLVIRYHAWRDQSPLLRQAAMYLGGPAVETFVLRKYRWTANIDPQELDFEDRENRRAQAGNRWLVEAANLPTAAGRNFRQQHADELLRVAEEELEHRVFGNADPPTIAGACPFLFLDNELGKQSLAWQNWPRFGANVTSRGGEPCYNSMSYLIAMEPAGTPDMYANAWGAEEDASTAGYALQVLRFLLPDKRLAVLDAIGPTWRERTRSIAPDPAKPWLTEGGPWRDNGVVIEEFVKMRYEELDDDVAADYALTQLRDSEGDERRRADESFAAWLAQHASRRPRLLERVAAAPEPEIRLLAVRALVEHPVAANRALLAALANDADDAVQSVARDAQAKLASD